ncbi:MAG TPA: 2-amino-4-hydroxy-6-hydroxymethyldihydropteridine diphosphokinase [Solirubrobacteraceae bacterium]
MEMTVAYLGLGANLGDRRAALQAAADALGATASSSVYETDPVGLVLDQPAFLNACIRVATDLDPEALLDRAKQLEADAGRSEGPRHGPRPLDVDILLYGTDTFASPRLTVPHPALRERRFVLVPLLELDFDLSTPDGARLSDALAVLPLTDGVRRHGPPLVT